MIYPIIPYGEEILRQVAQPLQPGADVKTLIKDMFSTMYLAKGVGLAAPQIGKSIQLFVADVSCFIENEQENLHTYKKVYINPTVEILGHEEDLYYDEGCLSIPGIYVSVPRKPRIKVKFFDINWQLQEEELIDFPARVIQHEYDHLVGKLHIDYLEADKRQLIESQLVDIMQGKVSVRYPIKLNNGLKK